MGNQTSKQKSLSSFSRSETGTSVQSGHSVRSKRSFKSIISQTSSRKSADLSRKGSSLSLPLVTDDAPDADTNNLNGTRADDMNSNYDDGGRPAILTDVDNSTKLNGNLPPSMIQVPPKSPILKTTASPVHHHNHHHHHHHRSHSKSLQRPRKHRTSNSTSVENDDSEQISKNGDGATSSKIDRPGMPSFSSSASITTNGESVYSYSSTSTSKHKDDGASSISRRSSASTTHSSRKSHSYNRFKDGQWVPKSQDPTSDVSDSIQQEQLTSSPLTINSSSQSNQEMPDIILSQDGSKNENMNGADSRQTDSTGTGSQNVHRKRKKKPLNIENLIQRLLDAGYSGKRTKSICVKNSEIAMICSAAREIFLSQPTMLELNAPVKIVGDIHGQYSDLIRIFTKCGFPPSANYLFLGDYVDRGKQSLETILLLFCYKIKYPENFFLLRGNHECAQITRAYGFYDECKRRTNIRTWKLFIDTFNTLPVCALVASKIFCVHGGLSPVLNSIDEIRNIKRPTDVPDFGLLNDLLWSDPADQPNEWEDNERGVSYCFNKVAINKFLNRFQFDLVCRAHMVVEDGYEFFNDRSLVTVFSAPNYCGEFDNWGAVMSVSEELLCSFELLDPLDSVALKRLMKQGRIERRKASLARTNSESTQSY